MYIKAAGCLLLLGLAAGVGKYKADMLKLRVERLEGMKRMIGLLQGELRFHRATLQEAFENTAVRIGKPYDVFLSHLTEKMNDQEGEELFTLWEKEIRVLLMQRGFLKEDRHLFELFCTSLGYLDLKMQMDNLNFVLSEVEESIIRAKDMERERGRLYRTMGVSVGALLVLMVI